MESIGSIGHESNDALVSRQDWACKFVTFRLVSAISWKWDRTTSWYLEITSSLVHPRRPRGSQPGREKRRDESFQVRVKEPLGTNSHRSISKNSSGCRSLIGHKKCFVLLCPIGEQVLLSSFREFRTRRLLSCHTCPVRSPRLCVQGKLLFSTFLTRSEGTTDESKKRLGCHQQEQFNLPREYTVFDSSQYIVNNKKFKMQRQRESQISNSLKRQKKSFARASHFFVHFFAVNCTTTRENA